MIRALAYLQWRSGVNRVRSRLRRLRQPKYLVGGLVGALYFYAVFLRNFLHGPAGGGPPPPWMEAAGEAGPLLELAGTWGFLLLFAAFWIIPSRRAPLEFSEAEIQFLFPAPVARRALIHYKLLSWQAGLLFTSAMVSLVTGRLFRGDGALMALFGWWGVFLLIQLHGLAASLARARLLSAGLGLGGRLGWALGTVAAVAVATGAGLAWAARGDGPEFPGFEDPAAFASWGRALSDARPWSWILAPFRCMARLVLTRDLARFGPALAGVLGMVVVHYAWVVHARIAFEESAVEAARAAADRLEAGRRGDRRPRRLRSRPRSDGFRGLAVGPPWWAIAGKNLISAGVMGRGVGVAGILAGASLGLLLAGWVGRGATWPGVVGGMALLIWFLSIWVGPGAARFDLRQDLLPAGDLLKALPLPGWQVVLGEIAAPWLVLSAVQAALALVAFGLLPPESRLVGDGGIERGIVWGCASLVAPALSLVALALQNAAVLLFPAWVVVPSAPARGGMEVMGQQLIVFVGQLLVLLVATVPAALAGGVVFALLAWGVGPWGALLPASVAAVTVLAGEAALLILLLGRLWERLDLSAEPVG